MKKSDEVPEWIDDDSPKPLSRAGKLATDVLALILVPFCFWAGWFEFGRAQDGRWQAWVYTFEWPLFGIVGIWLWRRIRSGNIPSLPKIEPPKFEDENKD